MQENVALMCTGITMPGRTINTSPYRIAGAPYKYPTQVQYSDITATFIGDKFLRLFPVSCMKIFLIWLLNLSVSIPTELR